MEEKTRADKINEDLYRKVQAHENELDRRQKKIQKLEAQLRRLLSGGSIEHIDEGPKTVRSSLSGSTQLASKAEESDMADLGAGALHQSIPDPQPRLRWTNSTAQATCTSERSDQGVTRRRGDKQ